MMEEPLAGGQASVGVVRVGATVRRWQAPNADFAHELLRYLAAESFGGAPVYLGVDEQGREILSHVEGWVPHDLGYGAWSEGQLISAVRLLRRFHDVTSGSPLAGMQEVVRHGDVNPTNMVWRDGTPRVLLDFDNARPGNRIDDVAYMGWTFVIAGGDDTGLAGTRLRSRRLRVICDAYGLSDAGALFDAMSTQQGETIALVRAQAALPRSKRSASGAARAIASIRAEMDWLRRHREELIDEMNAEPPFGHRRRA